MTLVDRPAPGAGEFEFDITTPLFSQIKQGFDDVESVDLSDSHLAQLEVRPAVYGLVHDGQLAYVGKSDANVRQRLSQHRRRLMGRVNIAPEDVGFRCVYLARTWDPFKPEEHLVRHYGTDQHPGWNGKGFGPKDPGRNRDHTDLGDTHWHVRFPLDPAWPCVEVAAGDYRVLDLLTQIKASCPFWVRFQGYRQGRNADSRQQYEEARADYAAAQKVHVPFTGMPAQELLALVAGSLPNPLEWQLTQLPSHLLLYKERDVGYPRMRLLWPDRPRTAQRG